MNVVNKGEKEEITVHLGTHLRRVSLKFKFLRAGDFFTLACSIISGADSGWF